MIDSTARALARLQIATIVVSLSVVAVASIATGNAIASEKSRGSSLANGGATATVVTAVDVNPAD